MWMLRIFKTFGETGEVVQWRITVAVKHGSPSAGQSVELSCSIIDQFWGLA